jgi:CheY-like chemotaxis protein
MQELAQGIYAGATASMVEVLLQEFLTETGDEARQIDADLAPGVDLGRLRRFAFHTKGQAHNFGFSLLEVVTQRMENYLCALGPSADPPIGDLRTFIETIVDILDGSIGADEDPAVIVRGLPARPAAFDVNEVAMNDVEVMLVMLHSTQTHFVEREMQACGYRVTIVTSTIEALEQAIYTKPNMIIVSAVMPSLSGIDLAVALTSMPETRNTPVALITSLPSDHDSLKLLPSSVPIIRKSDSFGDDLAAALDQHFLL